VTADGKVILNTASAADLQRLPGIGKKRAEKIIALRAKLKRFRKATDLLRVRGIGVKSLRKMLPHLVVDPPESTTPDAKNSMGERQR
jgi:competence protein ComEA